MLSAPGFVAGSPVADFSRRCGGGVTARHGSWPCRHCGEVAPQPLAGVRAFGLLVDPDARLGRKADEQRGVGRVATDEVDPHREALDDLHEVARGVLGRQERHRRRRLPGLNPETRPRKTLPG